MGASAILTHLTPATYRAMPWKNGLGVTTELAIHPPARGSSLEGFEWRLSIARVNSDGPFSSFEGYDRILTLLEGGELALTHDGGPEHRLEPFKPWAFDGGWVTYARLVGPALTDFNVVTRQGLWRARVEVLRPGAGEALFEGEGLGWLYGAEGAADVSDGRPSLRLASNESIRIDPSPGARWAVRVRGPATVIAVELAPA